MVYLNSTAIHSVEWNPTTRRMIIVFTSGGAYPFCGVPESIYRGLISASSAGAYYNAYIKGRYDC